MTHSQTDSQRCFTTNNDKLISVTSTKSVRLKPKGGQYDSKFRALTLIRNPLQQDQDKYEINYYDERISVDFPPSLLVLSSSGVLTRYLLIYFKNDLKVSLTMKIKPLPYFEPKKANIIKPESTEQETKPIRNSSYFMTSPLVGNLQSALPGETQSIFQKKEDPNTFAGGLFSVLNLNEGKEGLVREGLFSNSNNQANSSSNIYDIYRGPNYSNKKFELSNFIGKNTDVVNPDIPTQKKEEKQLGDVFGSLNLEKHQINQPKPTFFEKKAEPEKKVESSLFSGGFSNENNQTSSGKNFLGGSNDLNKQLNYSNLPDQKAEITNSVFSFPKKEQTGIGNLLGPNQSQPTQIKPDLEKKGERSVFEESSLFSNLASPSFSRSMNDPNKNEKKADPEKKGEGYAFGQMNLQNQANLNFSGSVYDPNKIGKKPELEKKGEGFAFGGGVFSNLEKQTIPIVSGTVIDPNKNGKCPEPEKKGQGFPVGSGGVGLFSNRTILNQPNPNFSETMNDPNKNIKWKSLPEQKTEEVNLPLFPNKKEQNEKEILFGLTQGQFNQIKTNLFERMPGSLSGSILTAPPNPSNPNKNDISQKKNENIIETKKTQLDAPSIIYVESKPKKEDEGINNMSFFFLLFFLIIFYFKIMNGFKTFFI